MDLDNLWFILAEWILFAVYAYAIHNHLVFFPFMKVYETNSTLFCTLHCLINCTTFPLVFIDVCENKLKVYAAMGTPEA
jgi:hypothetical protein